MKISIFGVARLPGRSAAVFFYFFYARATGLETSSVNHASSLVVGRGTNWRILRVYSKRLEQKYLQVVWAVKVSS